MTNLLTHEITLTVLLFLFLVGVVVFILATIFRTLGSGSISRATFKCALIESINDAIDVSSAVVATLIIIVLLDAVIHALYYIFKFSYWVVMG